ncbi:MAG: hypothetical protein OXF11_00210 [Deltaproteobacteria bacterium]|nr:hypothetical protein [Deltaproteobacteria bacterium]
MEDITLTLEAGRTVQWESAPIHNYFSDPDNDRLEYRATSYDGSVARVDFKAPELTLVIRALALGTARITLTARDPGGLSVTQSFTVTVNDGTALPPDHSDALAGATEVAFEETIKGYIDSPDDVDYLRLWVAEPGTITVTLDAELAGVEVSLLDSNGNVLAVAETASEAEIEYTVLRETFIFIKVVLSKDLFLAALKALVRLPSAWDIALHHSAAGPTTRVRIKPDAQFAGDCRCLAIVEPGGVSKAVNLADYFEGSTEELLFTIRDIPGDLSVDVGSSPGSGRLTISAPQGTDLGIYEFTVEAADTYELPDGRVVANPETSVVVTAKVNVVALPIVLPGQSLTVRAEPGKRTSIGLTEIIGPPENIGNHLPIRFQLDVNDPGTQPSISDLSARIESNTSLVVEPPSELEGEFSLKVSAWFPDAEGSREFTFRVIVGDVAGPRLIEGGPPLSVSVEQGGEVMIRLTDHIEDSEGGRLTFVPASLPSGLGVARNGPDWTIRVPLGAKLGEHVITLTATNENGMSADFALRIVVEEASAVVEPPFRIGEPPSDVQSCLATLGNSLQRLYDNLAQIGTTTLEICRTAYCPGAVGADAVKCSCCQTVEDYIQANPPQDVYIDGFTFECTPAPGDFLLTLQETVGSPIGEHFSIATRADQNMCRTMINNRRTQCRRVLDEELLPQIERFAPTFESCRRIFNAQVQDCESHFDGQRLKCGG